MLVPILSILSKDPPLIKLLIPLMPLLIALLNILGILLNSVSKYLRALYIPAPLFNIDKKLLKTSITFAIELLACVYKL